MNKFSIALLACALGAGSLLGAAGPASAANATVVRTRSVTTGRVVQGHYRTTVVQRYGYRYPYRYGYAYPYSYGYPGYGVAVGYGGVGVGIGYGAGYGYGGYGYAAAPNPAVYAPRPYWRPYRRVYRVRRY